MKNVVVVGGGISGLTVAYALINSSQFSVLGSRFDVTVLEADLRPGGKICTDRADGFLCEKGANGFLDNKPKTLELCDRLGISPLRSNENAKKRYIFFNGRLNALPESPFSFIKSNLISWPGKLRMAYEVIAPKGPDDETVADFIIRRLGQEALEKLIDPMVSGVFAGDPYRMSIKSCFPRIKELEQKYGSLIRAMIKIKKERRKESGRCDSIPRVRSDRLDSEGQGTRVSAAPGGRLTSFYNGAQVIVDALSEKLGNRVRTGISVKGLERKGNAYNIHTSEGIIHADIVVLASPAYASADIIKDLDKELSGALSGILYPSVSVICFGYKREKVGHALDGFGFLIPHKEGRKILGTLWDSSIFPNRAPEGHVLLRIMTGGAQSPEMSMLDDDALVRTVFDDLKPIVSLRSEPDMVRIYRWEKAIPQYVLGHGAKLQFMEERLKAFPGLYITGNAYRGIGINDCVENGYRVADEILLKIKN